MLYLRALEVCLRRGAIQIHVYLHLSLTADTLILGIRVAEKDNVLLLCNKYFCWLQLTVSMALRWTRHYLIKCEFYLRMELADWRKQQQQLTMTWSARGRDIAKVARQCRRDLLRTRRHDRPSRRVNMVQPHNVPVVAFLRGRETLDTNP